LRRKRRWVPPSLYERERKWIPPTPSELVRGIVNIFLPHRPEPSGPLPLDECGVPVEWRHAKIHESLLEHSKVHWELFERWCEHNGRTSFPADPYTCLDFLCAMWNRGPKLYETWRAIHERHDAYYWNSSANAVFRMRVFLGLDVLPDGTIVIRPVDPES
jgi:hypothetical protein